MLRSTITLAAALALSATCWAQDADKGPSLNIGDKAPAAKIKHFFKGDQLEAFEDGNIYVLEFWATWCGPCKTSMPHISKLQEQYADYDVRFIGISDEELDTVQGFLAKSEWDEKTRYTIATDPDRSVYNDYMKATNSRGIPTAFIVGKDGQLEWYGHPMEIDQVIEAVVQDSWDRDAFKQVLVLRKDLDAAMRERDSEAAVAVLDKLIEFDPYGASGYRFRKFMIMLTESDDAEATYAIGSDCVKDAWEDAMTLNQVAWFVVDQQGVKHRDLDFALEAARRANELTDGKDAAVLDTVARIYHDQGKLAEAVAWQTKAVDAADADSPMGEQIRKVLEQYKAEAEK